MLLKNTQTIFLCESASWNKKTLIVTPQLLIYFEFLYDQPMTFRAVPIPRENTPDWVKMLEFVLEKGPTLGSKIGPFFWSLVYPKCSKLEVYNPPGHDIGNFSIIYKSNDPQIFHLHNTLWVYKLFMFHVWWGIHYVMTTQNEKYQFGGGGGGRES